MESGHSRKLAENAEGEYYTTEECDGCAYCASVAPDNFDFNKGQNTYFVSRQPATPEEVEYVQEAMDDCPVDAIRREGPEARAGESDHASTGPSTRPYEQAHS